MIKKKLSVKATSFCTRISTSSQLTTTNFFWELKEMFKALAKLDAGGKEMIRKFLTGPFDPINPPRPPSSGSLSATSSLSEYRSDKSSSSGSLSATLSLSEGRSDKSSSSGSLSADSPSSGSLSAASFSSDLSSGDIFKIKFYDILIKLKEIGIKSTDIHSSQGKQSIILKGLDDKTLIKFVPTVMIVVGSDSSHTSTIEEQKALIKRIIDLNKMNNKDIFPIKAMHVTPYGLVTEMKKVSMDHLNADGTLNIDLFSNMTFEELKSKLKTLTKKLKQLHKMGLCHGDIKRDNMSIKDSIFLDPDSCRNINNKTNVACKEDYIYCDWIRYTKVLFELCRHAIANDDKNPKTFDNVMKFDNAMKLVLNELTGSHTPFYNKDKFKVYFKKLIDMINDHPLKNIIESSIKKAGCSVTLKEIEETEFEEELKQLKEKEKKAPAPPSQPDLEDLSTLQSEMD